MASSSADGPKRIFRRNIRVWGQERTSGDFPTWQSDVDIVPTQGSRQEVRAPVAMHQVAQLRRARESRRHRPRDTGASTFQGASIRFWSQKLLVLCALYGTQQIPHRCGDAKSTGTGAIARSDPPDCSPSFVDCMRDLHAKTPQAEPQVPIMYGRTAASSERY